MHFNGTVGIIPFKYFAGQDRSPGSTYLRAENLVAVDERFQIWRNGHKYDALIFQKVYWKEMMEAFHGPKILDLADPDWIRGSVDIKPIGSLSDAITCSSESLTAFVKNIFPRKPVYFIPDRLNFSKMPGARAEHKGMAKRAIWFGYSHNAEETLSSALPVIRDLGLQLTIVANKMPEIRSESKPFEILFFPYEHDDCYMRIRNSDIVLNLRSDRAFFKYKSVNKSIIAWKLGVPVAESVQDIIRLMDEGERNKDCQRGLQEVQLKYDIVLSAKEYSKILYSLVNR